MKRASKTQETCIAHKKMGAIVPGYAFIEIMGCTYALCYRCVQCLCGEGKPQRDELYTLENPSHLSGVGFMPRAGKHFNRDIIVTYEISTSPKAV